MENIFIPEVSFILNIRSLWIVLLNGQACILLPFHISKRFLLNSVMVLWHRQYALGEQGYKMSLQSKSKVTEKKSSNSCEIVIVWSIMKLIF